MMEILSWYETLMIEKETPHGMSPWFDGLMARDHDDDTMDGWWVINVPIHYHLGYHAPTQGFTSYLTPTQCHCSIGHDGYEGHHSKVIHYYGWVDGE